MTKDGIMEYYAKETGRFREHWHVEKIKVVRDQQKKKMLLMEQLDCAQKVENIIYPY